MKLSFPNFEIFKKNFQQEKSQWVSLDYVADLETPVSTYLKLSVSQDYSFLLESAEGKIKKSRYSFIGVDPDIIWRCRAQDSKIGSIAQAGAKPDYQDCSLPPLEALRDLWHQSRITEQNNNAPSLALTAVLFGYLSYDMIRLVERLETPPPDSLKLDDSIFIRPRLIVIFDNLYDKMTLITPVWKKDNANNAERQWEQSCAYLEQAVTALKNPLPDPQAIATLDKNASYEVKNHMTAEHYQENVEKARDYIREGDIFQIVLSQRFSVKLKATAFDFYRQLRRINPSPYLFFLKFKEFVVTGSSPEILVRIRNNIINIRPIAGTRKRGINNAEDKALAKDLLQDQKECAEHLMLLDLARNDAGRVARMGTVKVSERFTIEYYSHVMHIASQVDAELADDKDPLDALLSGFPAGTLSGAPKIRAMQLIDHLETEKRGIYGGCIGYLGANGDLDSCIALRMAVIKDGIAYIQAGAGIVADSVAEKEQEECLNKAKALLKAAQSNH